MDNGIEKFYEDYFRKYQDIIDIMKSECDKNNICKINQKYIALRLSCSQGLISKCLRRLERSDRCIEKMKSGEYKVNHTNTKEYGPFKKFILYITEIVNNKSFLEVNLSDRAEILEISYDEVKMVHYYFVEFYTHKYLGEL